MSRLGRLRELLRLSYRVGRREGAAVLASLVWRRVARGVGFASPNAPGEVTDEDYARWSQAREPSAEQLEWQALAARGLAYRPLVSILTPVYNVAPDVLRETILSVRRQSYPFWEWCLVDGGSTVAGLRELLREAAAEDGRVRVEFLGRNGGIAANTNAALALAGGDYVALLDHADVYAPNALYEVVQLLNKDRALDLVYFDEDKLSADGRRRHAPFFKPAWSPETLLSANYLTHPVVRRELLSRAGGFRGEFDGAQDWDAALRCTRQGARVAHVPKVLYHGRQIPASASAHSVAKEGAYKAQAACLGQHLRALGLPEPSVTEQRGGAWRVGWAHSSPKASLVIVTRDQADLLRKCVDSLLSLTDYDPFELVLVDNESADARTHAYYRELSREPRVRVVTYPRPFNYSAANNVGARAATGDVLVFLNNDVEATHADWLAELVRWAERPEVGVVGGKLLYPDRTIQHAGVVVGLGAFAADHVCRGRPEYYAGAAFGSVDWYRNYLAVTGACLAVRRSVFEELRGFDEAYRLCYSDVDLGVRAADLGYRNVYTPFATLLHHEGKTRGDSTPTPDLLRAARQLLAFTLTGDPNFNPNFSRASAVPRLREEPDPPAALADLLARFGSDEERGPEGRREIYCPGLYARTSPYVMRPVEYEGRGDGGRVLLAVPDLSGAPASAGRLRLARAARAAGFRVAVVAPAEGPLADAYAAERIPVLVNPALAEVPARFTAELREYELVVAVGDVFALLVLEAGRAGVPSLWLTEGGHGARPQSAQAVAYAEAARAAGEVVDALSAEPTEADVRNVLAVMGRLTARRL